MEINEEEVVVPGESGKGARTIIKRVSIFLKCLLSVQRISFLVLGSSMEGHKLRISSRMASG